MNIDLLSLIIFYSLIIIFFFLRREKFTIQNRVFALYKTSLGLGLMDRISQTRYKRLLKAIGYLGVLAGFAGMIFIFAFLIKETIKFLVVAGTPPPLAPVLPGVQIPGAPELSFWHWIISIFIVAIVHEFSHGIFARFENVKIKSSGFAFLGPILAAFVEPDEKELSRKGALRQLTVFAAGPFSNILLAVLCLLLFNFAIAPAESSMFEPVDGVVVNSLIEGYPMEKTEIEPPFIVSYVNSNKVSNLSSFMQMMDKAKPGEKVVLGTDKGDYEVVTAKNPTNNSKAFLGVSGFSQQKIKPFFKNFASSIMWVNLLIIWLFVINLGVGLFNLLPLGPVDGGRMFYIASLKILKKRKMAKRLFSLVSMICLILIFINLIPWIMKLVTFLFNSISSFF